MKLVITLLFFVVSISCNNKKNSDGISIETLIKLSQSSTAAPVSEYARSLGHETVDSSKKQDDSFMYFSRQPGTAGNALSWHDEKARRYLIFATYEPSTYGDLKAQLFDTGFTMKDTYRDSVGGMDEFEKGTIYVSIGLLKKESGLTRFEFFFTHKK